MKTQAPVMSTVISILSLTLAALPAVVMIQTGEPMDTSAWPQWVAPWAHLFILFMFAVAWATLWHNLGTTLQETTK